MSPINSASKYSYVPLVCSFLMERASLITSFSYFLSPADFWSYSFKISLIYILFPFAVQYSFLMHRLLLLYPNCLYPVSSPVHCFYTIAKQITIKLCFEQVILRWTTTNGCSSPRSATCNSLAWTHMISPITPPNIRLLFFISSLINLVPTVCQT